ncbi:hypothetical protein E2320_000745, partial [Naja naja]
IAFHFNPRFDEGNVIVCNTQEKGCWGPEERTSPMLFQRGVSLNQFIDYQHRLPMNLVQTLQIKGDVSLSCINFTGGFNFGGMTVCNPATPFHVNLKNILLGNIALHVNPRFKERALVRNSFINGAWGSEERNIAFLPFCPGQAFQLEITYLENCYQMLVNGQLKFEYIHRIPPSQVDQLEIAG